MESVANSDSILRKQIIDIQKSNLSPSEKAVQTQGLMSRNWSRNQPHKANDTTIPDTASNDDTLKTWNQESNQLLGCKHYQRNCKLRAECCQKWFTCRFCHDEKADHQITRSLTSSMMCMLCNHIQPAGQSCMKCETEMAKYYCQDCKLWENDSKKAIYHCKDCGICRIGLGLDQDYFHCSKCNACISMTLKDNHKCIERNLECDCPICGEFMFTSTTTVIFMPCGHSIHYKCHQEHTRTSYQCPTCAKSLADMTEYFKRIDQMLEGHTMPEEYKDTKSHIYCNDCEQKGVCQFHFLYHKCSHCKGFNTKIISTSGAPNMNSTSNDDSAAVDIEIGGCLEGV